MQRSAVVIKLCINCHFNFAALSPAEFKNDHMILCLDLVDCDSHAALTEQVIQRYGKVIYLHERHAYNSV